MNELVIGVQFAQPKGYQQIFAGDVWKLFRDDYPEVREQPSLPPSFETFGLSHQHGNLPQFSFSSGASHDRFWFLRPEGDELIQFQQDRFLHNWRKVQGKENDYPRFEPVIERFREELYRLQDYLTTLSPQSLVINQCEISYINHIRLRQGENSCPSNWLNFLNLDCVSPDDFALNFRKVIRDDTGKPLSRLYCDAQTGLLPTNEEIIVLTFTVRGAPTGSDIESAIDFLTGGRNIIVQTFAEQTTDMAHSMWKRTK